MVSSSHAAVAHPPRGGGLRRGNPLLFALLASVMFVHAAIPAETKSPGFGIPFPNLSFEQALAKKTLSTWASPRTSPSPSRTSGESSSWSNFSVSIA